MDNFILWFFLICIAIASLQDLKRREVDNWLNLFILFSGFGYLVFKSIFLQDSVYLSLGVICLLVMFGIANLFYYSRVFAGGDAKLLFSMFALFVGFEFIGTMYNIGWFVLFLLVSGSVYGLLWGFVLFIYNFNKATKDFIKQFKNVYLRFLFFAGIVLLLLSYFYFILLFISLFIIIGIILFLFAKSIENVSMIKLVDAKDLTEGDWLASDVRVGGKVIKSNWEGLSNKDLKILGKLKKKIKIKQGLPFVPAFFIAFILYMFKERIIEFILSFI